MAYSTSLTLALALSAMLCLSDAPEPESGANSYSNETSPPAQPAIALTVTEELIRREIIQLGGDWQGSSEPLLVAFLGEEFNSQHFEMLTHIPTLPYFCADTVAIDDFAFSCLSEVHGLERLEFWNCNLESNCWSLLRDNRDLRHLRLLSVTMSDVEPIELASLTQLEELELDDMDVSEALIREISTMQNLRRVNFTGCPQITPEKRQELRDSMPNASID